jgi:hypothetical protein
LEDEDVDGKLILKRNFKEMGCEDVDWIQVALDSVKLNALVNTVINLRVP